MDGLNKINRRQFLARLLGLGAAIALPRPGAAFTQATGQRTT